MELKSKGSTKSPRRPFWTGLSQPRRGEAQDGPNQSHLLLNRRAAILGIYVICGVGLGS